MRQAVLNTAGDGGRVDNRVRPVFLNEGNGIGKTDEIAVPRAETHELARRILGCNGHDGATEQAGSAGDENLAVHWFAIVRLNLQSPRESLKPYSRRCPTPALSTSSS